MSDMAGGVGACRGDAVSSAARAFVAVTVLLFLASAVATVACCVAMSAMGGMPMPGGWTASMVWQRMCGRTWPGTAASFLGMWLVMTVAMMLPALALAPVLWRYRCAVVATGARRAGWLTAQVALGYFLWWGALGAAVFPSGVALTAAAMRLPTLGRVVPVFAAAVVTIAGALQFTRWKRRRLACCRRAPGAGRSWRADVCPAWQHGLGLGMRCCACCAGPMVALLAIGVMELPAMAIVTAAISAERLARDGARAARVAGAIGVGAGLLLVVRGVGGG